MDFLPWKFHLDKSKRFRRTDVSEEVLWVRRAVELLRKSIKFDNSLIIKCNLPLFLEIMTDRPTDGHEVFMQVHIEATLLINN